MPVMHVFGVGVLVGLFFVRMRVAVFAAHRGMVLVVVMPVVVAMRVLVCERRVNVKMAVFFGQMQVHPERETGRSHA